MPLYEFFCATCSDCFEVRRTFSEGIDDVTCPTCAGDEVRRVFTPIMMFSSGKEGVSMIGGSPCTSCAITNCGGCPSLRRK